MVCWTAAVAKNAARGAYIKTAPQDDHPEGIWTPYGEGNYGGFLKAIGRITELDRIKTLHLRFSRHCAGLEYRLEGAARQARSYRLLSDAVVEEVWKRKEILETVFESIHRRNTENPNASIINSLTIENLQNVPLPEFTSSQLFKDVTEDIDHLHLMMAEEYNDAGPDWDMYCVERRVFEPYLESHWLTPLSSHLVSLTLCSHVEWGTAPGYFDGTGLKFPQLKTLTLGNFVIGHHSQFDWVTDQTSLTSLYLDRCSILSYVSVRRTNLRDWNIQTHDWHEYPTGSFGTRDDRVVYGYPGTWETIFDRIRSNLPNLMDFRFQHSDEPLFPVHTWTMSAGLSKLRYSTFDEEWREVDGHTGLMTFGDSNNWRKGQKRYLNRSQETEDGDGAALEALLAEIQQRQKQ